MSNSSGFDDNSTHTRNVTVPKTNIDPTWSLCPWPVEITIGKNTIEIPPLAAVEWLSYLLSSEPNINALVFNIFPEVEDYYSSHLSTDITFEGMYLLILEVIGTVSARPWWITLRIISAVANSWNVIGPKILMSGIDSRNVSLAAWIDVALALMIENMDPKNVTMFTLQLELPPPENLFGTNTKILTNELVTDRNTFLSMA